MERRKSENLRDVVMRFLRASGLESPLNEYRLIQAWPEVAGELVGEKTTEIYIRNQTLYVKLSMPALRSNLMLARRRLVELLNAKVGATVITEIVVR